jgi:hypothetical protein
MQLGVQVPKVRLSQALGGRIHKGLEQAGTYGNGETGEASSEVGAFQVINSSEAAGELGIRDPCFRDLTGIIQ